ncbi:MAG: 50S ribosomal protein L9 [Deltaproteobacteria bacterium]
MKLILIKPVKSLGKVGDMVDVSDGHARNYLIPNGYALEATEGNLKSLERKKTTTLLKQQKEKKDAGLLAQALSGKSFTIKKKVGEQNKLFGSVTSKDIQEEIAKLGIEIDKRAVVIDEAIKTIGEFSATVKLNAGEMAQIKVIVVATEG